MIPALTRPGVAHVYDFSTNVVPGQDERERGYWRDVGTLDAYYDANMDLIAPVPGVQPLQRRAGRCTPTAGAAPPAKVSRGIGGEPSFVDGSLLCQGSIVSGAHVERSIIGPSVFVDHDAHVTDSILFQGVHVGAGARLHRCIVDKNVVIPDWCADRARSRSRCCELHGEPQRHRGRREGRPDRHLVDRPNGPGSQRS